MTMGAQQNIVADGTVDLGSNSKPSSLSFSSFLQPKKIVFFFNDIFFFSHSVSTNSSVPDEQKSSCCG